MSPVVKKKRFCKSNKKGGGGNIYGGTYFSISNTTIKIRIKTN